MMSSSSSTKIASLLKVSGELRPMMLDGGCEMGMCESNRISSCSAISAMARLSSCLSQMIGKNFTKVQRSTFGSVRQKEWMNEV